MMLVSADPSLSGFAAELNRLCEARWPGGDRTANVEIAESLSVQTGRVLDRQFVWRIRTGRVQRVDARVSDALCRFFGVEVDHFTRASSHDVAGSILSYAALLVGVSLAELSAETVASGSTLARELLLALSDETSGRSNVSVEQG